MRIKRISRFARYFRLAFYLLLDFLGSILFFVLSIFRILPEMEELSIEKIKKVLIIRLDRIGDVILSTPAIRAVRESFPDAEIHMLVTEYTKDLVINNPDIDKLLIYKKDKIVDRDYDLAVALHPGITQNYLTFLSGAKARVGYTGWGGGFFLTHKIKDDRATRIRHEVESALELVGIASCKTKNKRLEISLTEEGERFAEDFFKKNNLLPGDLIVVIHPGARLEYIRWRKEGFAEVSNRLVKEENAKVILVGGGEEEQLIKKVVFLMEEKPLLAIGLRLTHLVSLIKRCSLFIGNSTGPMHIAAALGVPVMAIFGSVHPLDSYQEWGPWGGEHIVISKNLNCPDCHPSDCKTFDCIRLISVKDVLEAVKKQLDG